MPCCALLAGKCGVLQLELEVHPASEVLMRSVGTEAESILCWD